MVDFDDILDFYEDNKKSIIISVILLGILIALIVYLNMDFSHYVLFEDVKLFYKDEQHVVGFENMPVSEENIQYTFSAFIRLNNVSPNTHWGQDTMQKKVIINNYGSPNIVYYVETGLLVVEVDYKSSDGTNTSYEIEMKDFPMQKWTNVCLVVDGRSLKLYKDGEFYTAKKLHTIPWKNQKMMTIGKLKQNFNGYVGFVDYYNRPLNKDEVKELFKKRNKKISGFSDKIRTYEQEEYFKKKEEEQNNKLNQIKIY